MTIVCARTNKNGTHCGFLLASGQVPDDVSIKTILGFNGQGLPWAERDILLQPKLDGLPTHEILMVVSAGRAYGGA